MGEVRAVSDMHERKAEMARQADAFIALPGIINCVAFSFVDYIRIRFSDLLIWYPSQVGMGPSRNYWRSSRGLS